MRSTLSDKPSTWRLRVTIVWMFYTISPSGPLGELVELLWLSESEPTVGLERRLPTGRVEVVINLDDDRLSVVNEPTRRVFRGCLAVGATSGSFVLDRAEQRLVAGARLRPGAVRPLLGVSAHELADRHVPLEMLWGSAATALRDRLLDAPDAAARLAALEATLLKRIATLEANAHPLLAPALALLSEAPTRRVADVGNELGWTRRRVEQVFQVEVGITPAAYARLQRFRACLKVVDRAAASGWAAFALEQGYSDQSHLIREFRSHCGLSPSAYLRARRPAVNHVALPS